MVPSECEPRGDDSDQRAENEIEAEMVVFGEARGADVDCNGDGGEGWDDKVVWWSGCCVTDAERVGGCGCYVIVAVGVAVARVRGEVVVVEGAIVLMESVGSCVFAWAVFGIFSFGFHRGAACSVGVEWKEFVFVRRRLSLLCCREDYW